jgi:hypothetical protein
LPSSNCCCVRVAGADEQFQRFLKTDFLDAQALDFIGAVSVSKSKKVSAQDRNVTPRAK